ERPVLKITTWTNYMPEDVLLDFEKVAGCRVEIPVNYSSNDELEAILAKGPGFDLAFPSDVSIPSLVEKGLLQPLDAKKVPNLVHSDPSFSKRYGDPEGKWSVPYTWGTVGLAWRTDRLKSTPDSWSALGERDV